MQTRDFECCICGTQVSQFGNNPEPFMGDRCCDDCNDRWVIPARMTYGRNAAPDEILPLVKFARLAKMFVMMRAESTDAWAKRMARKAKESKTGTD